MKFIFGLVLIFCLGPLSWSQEKGSFADRIDEANKAFSEGDTEKALNLYHSVIEDDMVSAELYLNLGNIYFKRGAIAEAILSYERGLKLDPHSEMLKANIVQARKQIRNDVIEISEFYPIRIWNGMAKSLSGRAWFALEIVLALVLLTSLFFWRLRSNENDKLRYFISSIVSLIAFLMILSLGYRSEDIQFNASSAILMEDTQLFSGADERSESLRALSSGLKLEILDREIKEWYKVSLPNKEEGWIMKSTLEEI